jgi:hypothetical protein
LCDQRGEVEGAQAERRIEIVAAVQRARLVRALAQERVNLVVMMVSIWSVAGSFGMSSFIHDQCMPGMKDGSSSAGRIGRRIFPKNHEA